MGSFNIGCGMSNLSINGGDKVGFTILGKALDYQRMSRYSFPDTHTFRVYTTDDYRPFLPPVYGVYDDYGRISDLEESVTTSVIEAIFRRPALDVINAIGSDRNLYSSADEITELYIPKSVLNTLGAWKANEADKFKAVSFTTETPSEGYAARYDYRDYKFERKLVANTADPSRSFDQALWNVTNTVSNKLVIDGFLPHPNLSTEQILSAFACATGLLPGFAEEDWSAITHLRSLHGMFFLEKVFTDFKDYAEKDEYDLKAYGSFDKDMEQFFSLIPGEQADLGMLLNRNNFVERSTAFNLNEHAIYLALYAGNSEYSDIYRLITSMMMLNRMIQPSFCGEQDGNDEASRKLNSITDEILKDRDRCWDE